MYPINWHSLTDILSLALVLSIFVIPGSKILHKAGFSRWWVCAFFVPIVGIIGLWVFAFRSWPNLKSLQN